jgi:hypothetical protein
MTTPDVVSVPKPGCVHPVAYSGDVLNQLQHWRHRHIAHSGELYDAAAEEIIRLKKLLLKYAGKLSRAEAEIRALKGENLTPIDPTRIDPTRADSWTTS